jgi:hypothetical protein
MAANSKKVEDIYLWLIKVLESCVTKDQHFTARKLVRRFQHEEIKKYNLCIGVSTEMYNKLDEAIRDGLNRILQDEIIKDRMTTHPEYPYNDPWWGSTPEDIKRWMELNEETKKITKYWNDRMTEPPPGSMTIDAMNEWWTNNVNK